MNLNNCFVMFCLVHLSLFESTKCKKSFKIKFYIPHLENLYTFQIAKYYIKNLRTVDKTCKKVLRLKVDFSNKSESRTFSF